MTLFNKIIVVLKNTVYILWHKKLGEAFVRSHFYTKKRSIRHSEHSDVLTIYSPSYKNSALNSINIKPVIG